MKDRILAYLYAYANGKSDALSEELKAELGMDDPTFRTNAQELLASILHGYAQFSISTIDAFFQKVIRSFTREAGLVGDYRLEVETDVVLEEVIDQLMDELGNNDFLTDWLVEFANENLENDRAWDVRANLIDFSKEIFSENFKAIEDELTKTASRKDYFPNLLNDLRKSKFEFINFVKVRASKGAEIIAAHGLTDDDFKWGGGGVYNYFKKLSKISSVKDYRDKGARAEKEFLHSKEWPNKKSPNAAQIIKLAEHQLIPIVGDLFSYHEKHVKQALSAEVVLSNFYEFGLLFEISRKLHEYKEEHSMMLLADAPKFLNGLIGETDTPFIYEKVGSFYKNFLIDEFQDTSGMQWKNFLPLLTNSLDQGLSCMVVGDVKQAIYRWRGGDLKLLQQAVEEQIGKHRIGAHALNQNFRSSTSIVSFNNLLFQSMSTLVAADTSDSIAEEAYRDVVQLTPGTTKGHVTVKFLSETGEPSWKEQAMDQLTSMLEKLQLQGIPLKDIAILVRKKEEGQNIVAHLVKYKDSDKANRNLKYDVISSESLRLDGASSINLLLGAMQYLANPDNAIARAQLGYEFARLHEPDRQLTEVFSVSNQLFFENNLPEAFSKAKLSLKKLPLFELTETLIEIFDLGGQVGELSYLQAFQDLVLEFTGRERSDLNSFLEWWELNKKNKSIQVSDQVNAAQILTIHKSKGLQFRYVIVPFCSWNMDHEGYMGPNLWVKSDQGIFDKAGYIPVRYKSALKETHFNAEYNEERTRAYLDNLNLLYVALTRAEEGMTVLAPHPEGVKNMKHSVAAFMYNGIAQSLELLTNWDKAAEVWSSGDFKPEQKSNHRQTPSVHLSHYQSTSWREKLVIRQSGRDYFGVSTEDSPAVEKRNYGIHLHQVFSRIKYKPDVTRVMAEIKSEGWLTPDDVPALEMLIGEMLNHPQISSWFAAEWEVRTEVPILLPGGKESRIDRLLINGNKAVVIDYKTGNVQKTDQAQVKEYMDTLKAMGFTEVEGHLLYLKTGETISIPPGKLKVTKRKEENQLGLDF